MVAITVGAIMVVIIVGDIVATCVMPSGTSVTDIVTTAATAVITVTMAVITAVTTVVITADTTRPLNC